MRISDWSSDVCSSDLAGLAVGQEVGHHRAGAGTEAEPDVPVAEGEDRIAMARRAADDRHGVRHRGAEAHPAAFLAPVEAGEPAARSEEHTSELQSLMRISYAVFCLKKKIKAIHIQPSHTK